MTVPRRPLARPSEWSLRADAVRTRPLEPLAVRLGYRPDPRHRRRWRLRGSLLAIDGERFFDHFRDRGGGGAIDLVMHVRRCDFRQAVEYLEGAVPLPPRGSRHPSRRAQRPVPAAASRTPLQLPPENPACWPPVLDYLLRTRGLDPALLDRCRRDNSLYADSRRNAVFTCRDLDGRPQGAEIAGTRPRPDGSTYKALAPGSRRARGGFRLVPPDRPPAAILVVESAVDALSAACLPAPGLPPDTLIASTAGTAPDLPPWLPRQPDIPVLCGYDADPAGDRAAASLLRRLPHARRLRPAGAKDWNDLLRRRQHAR